MVEAKTFLLVDTSLEEGFVALAADGEVSRVMRLRGQQGAQELTPALAVLLREQGRRLREVDCVAVAAGPGSYTGLRLGVIAAKAVAYALGVPLVGVPSVAAYAPPLPFDGSFVVLVDARMGGVYMAHGLCRGHDVAVQAAEVCALDELNVRLDSGVTVVSPHRARLEARLCALDIEVASWRWHDVIASPELFYEVARDLYAEGLYSRKGEVEILYLRRTQAEIECG